MYNQTQNQSFGGYVGGFNQFRHYARSSTPADTDIVTPNWLDLRAEPFASNGVQPDVKEASAGVKPLGNDKLPKISLIQRARAWVAKCGGAVNQSLTKRLETVVSRISAGPRQGHQSVSHQSFSQGRSEEFP